MNVILLRHGETEWSRAGRHTGRTDLPLTPHGEEQARALSRLVAGRSFALVLVSPAQRARRTAELAGAGRYEVDPNLWEWDYGGYEGITTAEIRRSRPGWYVWRDGVIPGDEAHPGETVEHVGERADKVLARIRPADGDVLVVAHAHMLRVLAARWLSLPADHGRLFRLDTGTYSVLGHEHDEPVLLHWNVPA
ncbi:histidine phosphatase family protein [Microbispora hainanensis]|jgi:probable phosphoglycerate mutase|uniref:Histidine phosphatase family protein n=1 Tax=Microbispora hainanensis TaxID=568844 RepID=A0ABZ1SV26_9ACTN|nr:MULTISPECIES: histidine phosphatase family protein [Microbispora]NJP22638.1 histidine phosphatase family protein [Microbispora sp. CL1-1]TQS16691.1 histidine phosphatase family protein [Microbispora sp. SCL1-1]